MKRILTALTLSAVLASPAWSESITLKCDGKNYGTPQKWEMHLNLDKEMVEFESGVSTSLEINDKYISWRSGYTDVGNYSISVLNRETLVLIETSISDDAFKRNGDTLFGPMNFLFQCGRGI